MTFKNVVFAFLIATVFASWGIVGRYTRASNCWVSVLVNLGTTFTLLAIYSSRIFSGWPDRKAALILAAAGIVNGFAVWLFTVSIMDPSLSEVQAAAFITLVFVAMIMITPVANLVVNRVVPTSSQAIGYGLAVAAVYFLSK